MALLDIVDDRVFSPTAMSTFIDRCRFVPNRIAQLNVFTDEPIRTDAIAIGESTGGTLKLLQTSQRGSPLGIRNADKQILKSYGTVRVGEGTRILASELQFIKDYGRDQAVKSLQVEISRRWGGNGMNTGLVDDMNYTQEHMMLGAIQGKFLDADGSVLLDWNDEFDGVNRGADLTFDFATAGAGEFRKFCIHLKRETIRKADGTWNNASKLHVLCSDEFWDEMQLNKEVVEQYKNAMKKASYVPEDEAWDTMDFAGITFENYRGSQEMGGGSANSEVGIAAGDAICFPKNTAGAFQRVLSPAESFGDIGTSGKSLYSRMVRDKDRDEYVDLEVRQYPLYVCRVPAMLRRLSIV